MAWCGPAPTVFKSKRHFRRNRLMNGSIALDFAQSASVCRTNGTSLSENLYIAWLYAGFRVAAREAYINEHDFNKPKSTCFTAKYTTAHICMTFD